MATLPTCQTQTPACGACGENTRNDGDGFYCESCLLNYFDGEDGTEAEFMEDVDPCGVPCSNTWHVQFKMICGPCKLPKGHTSMCWTGCHD